MHEDNVLRMTIKKGKKNTDEDAKNLYYTIYKLAENLGFRVIAPKSTDKQLKEENNGESERIHSRAGRTE